MRERIDEMKARFAGRDDRIDHAACLKAWQILYVNA